MNCESTSSSEIVTPTPPDSPQYRDKSLQAASVSTRVFSNLVNETSTTSMNFLSLNIPPESVFSNVVVVNSSFRFSSSLSD